jgi:hypothetical protein
LQQEATAGNCVYNANVQALPAGWAILPSRSISFIQISASRCLAAQNASTLMWKKSYVPES